MANIQNIQNIQNMQNMMNMFPQAQAMVFNPLKINPQTKKNLMTQTITQTKIGMYKQFPKPRSLPFSHTSNFNPDIPNNICETEVIYEHVIDIAEKYADPHQHNGINFFTNNNKNPVVLNIVGKEFAGTNLETNEHVRDEIINIRTTFNNSIGSNGLYPMKDDECIYAKNIVVIRPKNPFSPQPFLPYSQIYRLAMITTCPIVTTKLLSGNRMNSHDFVATCTIIECVFQTAIATNHTVLILSPFGHEDDNNPVDDIITIYNYCILKYGHMFEKIIVGVPPHYPEGIYKTYAEGIINLNELVSEIDKKYEKEELRNNLIARGEMAKAYNQNNLTKIDDEGAETETNNIGGTNNINGINKNNTTELPDLLNKSDLSNLTDEQRIMLVNMLESMKNQSNQSNQSNQLASPPDKAKKSKKSKTKSN